MNDIKPYLNGKKLYGDDLGTRDIAQWYREEEEGFSQLSQLKMDKYKHHALNWIHGYSKLPEKEYECVLGFGAARGDELRPIREKIAKLMIIEPSERLRREAIKTGINICEKPKPDGKISYPDETFDLITVLGVLHHIPNVTKIVNELTRCLKHDGYLLLREPVVSMGDWRIKRTGLTKNERGIPINILREIIEKANYKIESEAFCIYPPIKRIAEMLGVEPYNSKLFTFIDSLICRLHNNNVKYHADHILEKLRPTSVFYVLSKRKD